MLLGRWEDGMRPRSDRDRAKIGPRLGLGARDAAVGRALADAVGYALSAAAVPEQLGSLAFDGRRAHECRELLLVDRV